MARPATYNDLVDKAVFQGGDKDSSAYLSSMVKAFMKDGNVDHALQFFEEQIKHRRNLKAKEEEQLLNLFNSTFANCKDVSIADFKEKYLTMMAVREQTRKELIAISGLEAMLVNCSPEEIENALMMQLISKEQRQIVQRVCGSSDYNIVMEKIQQLSSTAEIQQCLAGLGTNLSEEDLSKLSEELQLISERKRTLADHVTDKSRKAMVAAAEAMQDRQIEILEGVASLDDALERVGMTK